ncbi:glycerol kinase [Haloactinopolyspora alba]|uniref:ATP:glycerol 3-phosphotransferase n=1 Tax=Haloactinopolyspora alba TaxID=648780 RepID=A0A2P8DT09_9ACTN|nr:FGGY family carbohydrate kinase [Haloactinopolyspora alba]PSL00348.1 glycerol kinase [Haloactinopolyspora alba]
MPLAFLAIDQGTTNTKVLLVAEDLRVLARGSSAVPLDMPAPAWFEQDAEVIWAGVLDAVEQCMNAVPNVVLAGVTISVQRESVVAWRRSDGRALAPVIGWQDGRMAEFCAELAAEGADAMIRARTGLRLDPMFSAPKMRWLVDSLRSAGAASDDLCLGTVDAFLVHRLTGGDTFATEAGCASRTLLLDVDKTAWSPELLDTFGIPAEVLPEVRTSAGGFGRTAGAGSIPADLPVLAVLGDSHAALYAQGCRTEGAAKATYGTGSSVMAPAVRRHGFSGLLSTTLAWQIDDPAFALEGNILATGAALASTARLLGVADGPALAALAATVSDAGGLIMVPAFAGLAAPHWDRDAQGLLVGLAGDTEPAQVARAAIDAVAHQVCDVVDVIDDENAPLVELRADGGGSRSDVLMQAQADLLGRPVAVSAAAELSALGVVELALNVERGERGAGPGGAVARVYEPQIDVDRRAVARARWRDAIRRSRGLDTGR